MTLNNYNFVAIRPDEIESAKKHGAPLEVLISNDEEEDLIPVSAEQQVTIQSSTSFEEISSVSHTESFSVENTAFSPVTQNK